MSDKLTRGEMIAADYAEQGYYEECAVHIDVAISEAIAKERKRAEGLREALVLVDRYLTSLLVIMHGTK